MLLLLVLLGAQALAQTTVLTAPWLVVYDPEGRPRWEIRMEKLVRTREGWEGEGVSVTLFLGGSPRIKLQAPRLSADPLGRRWSLTGGLVGEGEGFTFSAREANWADRLSLTAFSGEGEGLSLTAQEARWELSGPLELFSAEAQASGWILGFPYGKYQEGLLVAQDVVASGHGLSIRADFLEFHVGSGRAKFRGVRVVRGP
jgi:hypothetical protein